MYIYTCVGVDIGGHKEWELPGWRCGFKFFSGSGVHGIGSSPVTLLGLCPLLGIWLHGSSGICS